MTVLGLRLAIVNEVTREMEAAGSTGVTNPGTNDNSLSPAEAMSKFEDYC